MKERPILFNAEMVRAVLDGRNDGDKPKKTYALAPLNETHPQHIANRLMRGVDRIDKNDCWIWGKSTTAGYGSVTVLGRTQRAHILSWWVTRGKLVPSGYCVCHKCDEPLCINPEHLFLGTHSDNMKDMVAKGRHGGPPRKMPKEDNPSAKLNQAQVDEIRLMLKSGVVQREIADKFGVSQSQISNIKRGTRW